MEEINVYPDHLEHHGILGQKWGIRRYQNEDGSLTDEGRRRYTEIDRQSGYYKNTVDRARKGASIGGKIGIATGVAHMATWALIVPSALPSATIAAGLYAVSGYAHGALYGTIYGAIETKQGQKYIEKYDREHSK